MNCDRRFVDGEDKAFEYGVIIHGDEIAETEHVPVVVVGVIVCGDHVDGRTLPKGRHLFVVV